MLYQTIAARGPAHPIWIEATRYLNMDLLREQQKERHLGTAA
jgi:hypothetical protein